LRSGHRTKKDSGSSRGGINHEKVVHGRPSGDRIGYWLCAITQDVHPRDRVVQITDIQGGKAESRLQSLRLFAS
jgi:hypothetical protein